MGVSVVAKYTMKVYFYIRVSVSFPLRLKLDSIALEQLDTCTRGLGLYLTIINIIYWHEWTQDDFYARRNIFSSMRIMGNRSLAVDSRLRAPRSRDTWISAKRIISGYGGLYQINYTVVYSISIGFGLAISCVARPRLDVKRRPKLYKSH